MNDDMKAPFFLGNVRVNRIEFNGRIFDFTVYIAEPPIKHTTPRVQKYVAEKVRRTVNYLVDEGFVPVACSSHWQCQVQIGLGNTPVGDIYG